MVKQRKCLSQICDVIKRKNTLQECDVNCTQIKIYTSFSIMWVPCEVGETDMCKFALVKIKKQHATQKKCVN